MKFSILYDVLEETTNAKGERVITKARIKGITLYNDCDLLLDMIERC